MTTAEYKARRDAGNERDLRMADRVVAAGAIVITLLWVKVLVELLPWVKAQFEVLL